MTQDSTQPRVPLSQPARRAHALATFRWVEVRMMELLAGWVPTTPEMEVKLLMGEHLYNLATHADAIGHRTRELRAPLHDSKPPVPDYVGLLDRLARCEPTAERLAGFYRALLPGLARRYHAYIDATDEILDAPSIRIIDDVLRDSARMIREYESLVRELPELGDPSGEHTSAFAEAEVAIGRIEQPVAESGTSAR